MCGVGGTSKARIFKDLKSQCSEKKISFKILVIVRGHMRLEAEEKGLVPENCFKEIKGAWRWIMWGTDL
jgi:hypothetical protein